MANVGIDYGRGMTNRNHESGIRYGVISQNEVLQVWADSSEAVYGDEGETKCPECGKTHEGTVGTTVTCECGEEFDLELSDCAEPLSFTYEKDGYKAECSDDGDIFVIVSPYFTYAQFCSPCAPGACYLMSPLDDEPKDNRCYCFGHDWFEDETPYPVYSVTTGELVSR